MAVDLAPVEELDLDDELLAFVRESYCANCQFFEQRGPEKSTPYCTHWQDSTRVEPGYVCEEYLPQGYVP